MKPSLSVVTGELPDPPYPANTRAKGMHHRFDMESLVQSRAWLVTPLDLRNAMTMTRIMSWGQVPCGSLPSDDDELIAALINTPLNFFRANREALLIGWRLHSDGRLYNPDVTEKVLEIVEWRDRDAARKERYRANKAQMSHGTTTGQPRDSTGADADGTTPELELELEPEQKLKSKTTSKDTPSPPAWLSPDVWGSFVEHRRKIRSPMTDQAMRLVWTRLDEFRGKGHNPETLLNAAIEHGWKTVYEPRPEGHRKSGKYDPIQAAADRLRAAGRLGGRPDDEIREPVRGEVYDHGCH